jgi:hypothetical protein
VAAEDLREIDEAFAGDSTDKEHLALPLIDGQSVTPFFSTAT